MASALPTSEDFRRGRRSELGGEMGKAWLFMCAAMLVAASLGGCDQDAASSSAPADASNLPAFPSWAAPMIGQEAAPAYDQSKACLGHFDAVSAIHKGERQGFEVYGWAWDQDAAAPAARVVFADTSGRIVGGGDGGSARPDVPKVLPKVTSGSTGWRGVIAAKGGKISAFAVLKSGKQCDIGSLHLPDLD